MLCQVVLDSPRAAKYKKKQPFENGVITHFPQDWPEEEDNWWSQLYNWDFRNKHGFIMNPREKKALDVFAICF